MLIALSLKPIRHIIKVLHNIVLSPDSVHSLSFDSFLDQSAWLFEEEFQLATFIWFIKHVFLDLKSKRRSYSFFTPAVQGQ